MKALTLWQPWASLCVIRACEHLRQPVASIDSSSMAYLLAGTCPRCGEHYTHTSHQPFKTIETRSWKAPDSLIGGRIAIHAAVRRPRLVEADPINESLDGLAFSDRVTEWTIDRRIGPGEWSSANTVSDHLPLGEVVGTAVLADCVPMMDLDASRDAIGEGATHLWVDPAGRLMIWRPEVERTTETIWDEVTDQRPFGIFEPGRWAWLLDDVERFDEPVPATGRQGLWNWEPTDG